MNLSLILSKLGIPVSLSQDIILLLAAVLISFIFGTFIGRYRLVTVLINIYVSFAVVSVIPQGFLSGYSTTLLIFGALVILLTIFGRKLFEIHISGAGSGFLWKVFVMSFLEVGLILSIILSMLPSKVALSYVSSNAYNLLVSGNAQFIWMIAPLVFMLFMHRRMR